MLGEVGNEWTLDQSYEFIVFNKSHEFIVFNSLKSQNSKQKMNRVGFLLHASKFKGYENKMGIQQEIIKHSTQKYEGWHSDDSFQLLLWDDTYLLDFILNWFSNK